MKSLLFIILLSFSLSPKLNAAEDTLLVKWNNKELSDSIRIHSLSKYIWNNYVDKNSDSSEFYIDKLFNLSNSLELQSSYFGKVNSYMMRGVLKLRRSEYDEALTLFNQSLETSKNSTYKFNIAHSKFYIATTYYYQGKFELASVLFEELTSTYKKLKADERLANTYVNLGSVYRELANYKKAVQNYNGALYIYINLENKEQVSAIYNNLGLIYVEKGEYLNALEYFEKSLKIKEKTGDRSKKASTLHNIGLIYLELQEYEKALKFISRSIAIEKEIGNTRGIANSYVELGSIFLEQKEFNEALHYLKKSLEMNKNIGSRSGIAYSQLNLGNLYFDLNNFSASKDYFEKSLEYYKESGEEIGNSHALSYLGLINIKQGNIQSALINCKRSNLIAMESEDINTKKLSCDCLYQTYKAMSQPQKALHYYEKFVDYTNEMNIIESSKNIQRKAFQKLLLADSLKIKQERLATKLKYEKRISEENQQRNIALGIGLIFILVAGGLYNRNRFISKTKNEISKERDRSEKLLLNILPAEIAKELKEKGKSEARDFDNVSIMFTDFKEFTQASEKLTAHELIDEINLCFEQFDTICDKYKIEKIKTIGDSYMAAGGLPEPNAQSTKNIVLAGIEIAEFITNRKTTKQKESSLSFEMRLGIHTGPVVAGIVGVKKFQYDVWGDTVNTASRMETAGEVGKVNISQNTYKLLKNDPDFTFEHRGKVQAKGKGEIDMYFVQRADKL